MLINTQPYKFDKLYERILNSRSGNPAIRGKNLRARITGTKITGKRAITIRHYNTDIAVIEEYSADGTLYLWIDANGYRGATTKHYLNEIFRAYNVGGVRVHQKDYVWYISTHGLNVHEFEDGFALWGTK